MSKESRDVTYCPVCGNACTKDPVLVWWSCQRCGSLSRRGGWETPKLAQIVYGVNEYGHPDPDHWVIDDSTIIKQLKSLVRPNEINNPNKGDDTVAAGPTPNRPSGIFKWTITIKGENHE